MLFFGFVFFFLIDMIELSLCLFLIVMVVIFVLFVSKIILGEGNVIFFEYVVKVN